MDEKEGLADLWPSFATNEPRSVRAKLREKTLPTLNPSEPRNSHVATYVATYPEFHAPVSELEPESDAEHKTEPETEIGAETRQKEIPRPGAKQSQRQ